MTREDLVEELLAVVTRLLPQALAEVAMEDRLRLGGLERFVGAVLVGIRHIIKKRLDVAGAWTEDNGKRMLALISVRASGLWEDFWRWRDRRDVAAWHRRQRGEARSRFRGRPRAWPREVTTATQLAS